jgi:pimeloyl-ACP methyl ester carboxylesterase
MKKRAGIVGAKGLRPVLDELQRQSPTSRIHLVGHSFGCKLLLSTIVARSEHAEVPAVSTVVLIQPAISAFAFASEVPGTKPALPGAYRPALEIVRGPIIATFTAKDGPLNLAYPLGARLAGASGELEAVSRYAAMGAVGIEGAKRGVASFLDKGADYGFKGAELYQVHSTSNDHIAGHGDFENEHVAWLIWSAATRR